MDESTCITSSCERIRAKARAGRLWTSVLLSCAAAGCGGRAPTPRSQDPLPVASATPDHDEATTPSATPPSEATCAGIGAVACDTTPTGDKPADLCAQVAQCLLNKGDPDDEFGVITAIEDCEPLSNLSEAPGASGLSAVGFVTVTGELAETPAEGTFLFVRTAQGLCLADRVLNMEWFHGGHFETEIETRWEEQALHIYAQRLKRIPLDQSAEYEPGADVDWIACKRLVYEVRDGNVKRVNSESSQTACKKSASRRRK